MYEIFFVFTASMLILASIKILSVMVCNVVELPTMIPGILFTPANAFVLYPSLIFQVYFWTDKLQIVQ